MNRLKVIATSGIILFCLLMVRALLTKGYSWFFDSLFSILVIIFCFFYSEKLKLPKISFCLVIFALFLHNAGIFGFYGSSPVSLPWDHVTHFVGLFAVGIFFFNYFKNQINFNHLCSFSNFFILFIILLASLGIGSLIENIEFTGYLTLGNGEGGLMYGEGDGIIDIADTDMINIAGGGWFNAMRDLVVNLLGALLGILIMVLSEKLKIKFNKV